MKIMLYGATDTGYLIIARLYKEHDISIVDEAAYLPGRFLELDIGFTPGSGSNIAALESAGVKKAALFIACSSNDEANVVACWTAKRMSDIDTVCFVSQGEIYNTLLSPDQYRYKTEYDIDRVIWPEQLLTEEIFRTVLVKQAIDVEYFDDGKVKLFEYRIKADSPLNNTKIKEYPFPEDLLVTGITKNNNSLSIPDGNTRIEVGDKIIFMGTGRALDHLAAGLFQNNVKVSSAAIIGGGNVGYFLAKKLEATNIKVKILEHDESRCNFLSENLKKSLVLCGDGTNLELLEGESFGNVDVVICVTNNDEKNLLCSLLAKQLGAGKVVTRVDSRHNVDLFERVGVDVVVSPKESAMKELLNSYLKPDNVDILAIVGGGNGEVIDVAVAETFHEARIADIELPSEAIIGVLKRGRQIIIPNGDTMIYPGDRLNIVTITENRPTLKRVFEK